MIQVVMSVVAIYIACGATLLIWATDHSDEDPELGTMLYVVLMWLPLLIGLISDDQ